MPVAFATAEVTLGGQVFVVQQLPYNRLKKFVPILSRLERSGDLASEAAFDAMAQAFLIGLSDQAQQEAWTLERFEALPVSLDDMAMAVATIASLCGLRQGASPPNVAAPNGAGTPSTPT